MTESAHECMWCTKPDCDGTHEFELDVTADTVKAAVEGAVREEREAVVRYLESESAWAIAVFGIKRGEHRK